MSTAGLYHSPGLGLSHLGVAGVAHSVSPDTVHAGIAVLPKCKLQRIGVTQFNSVIVSFGLEVSGKLIL